LPHIAQLLLSEEVSVHTPLGQDVFGDGHAHAPAVQTSFLPQALPQAPQFSTSVLVFAQRPLSWQNASPEDEHAHTPLTQVSPPVVAPGHVLPHAPQLLSSVCSFLQIPSQHALVPGPQALLHAPQFIGSDCSATHTPPHADSCSSTPSTTVVPQCVAACSWPGVEEQAPFKATTASDAKQNATLTLAMTTSDPCAPRRPVLRQETATRLCVRGRNAEAYWGNPQPHPLAM
jgi:hypothetical protein